MARTRQLGAGISRLAHRGISVGWLLCLTAAAAAATDEDFFERRIRPVLAGRCYECHGAASQPPAAGLRVDSHDALLTPSKSGRAAIVPGNAAHSPLVEVLRAGHATLPARSDLRLSSEQLADFVAWIESGAHFPTARPAPSKTAHWAFQSLSRSPLPKVSATSWPRTSIDRFILAKLESRGLQPAPPADKRTLLRRATYDLTGLPPTPKEAEAFQRDTSPEAFACVVDRLLDSPHYGERWGRHWLDVARYSDTKGYVYDREEKRFVHSHVYRDWVVRALNEDLPYDQFLLQQIAADQLEPAPHRAALAALGFFTVGRRFLGVQHDIIDDRIDVLTRGTMGLSVACARCHDHKYDPIPTQDYYSLYGVFSSTSEKTVALETPSAPTREQQEFLKGLREREENLNKTFERKRAGLNVRLRAKTPEYLAAVLDVAKLPSEEFYAIMGPDDLNPIIVRQWEQFIFQRRGAADPIFGLWSSLAALPEKEFAPKAPEVVARILSASLSPSDGERVGVRGPGSTSINPLIARAFTNAPASMRETARRYGEAIAAVNTAWIETLNTATTNKTDPPTALDAEREPLRQILYGSGSPASVPNGAIIDLEWFFDEGGRVELAKLQAEIDRWIINSPGATPHAVVLEDRPEPRNARVFVRGNPANKAEEVPRQFLQVVAGPDRKPFQHGSGRLELARAIASPDNPLTARVMVNRVWQHHFGAGLVTTPSDFGKRAEPPSHPKLLDWLACEFVEPVELLNRLSVKSGKGSANSNAAHDSTIQRFNDSTKARPWSLKHLHRLILLSAVYQQSSDPPGMSRAKAARVDPENRLLSRANKQRLDFESMRDSLLYASGELDLTIGGKAVDILGKKPVPRRTLYGYIDRQFVPATFRAFDFANPDLHIPQRSDTTVPQQALFFLNSAFVADRARALARRADVQSAAKPADRVRHLYRIAFQREPTAKELDNALAFLKDAESVPPPPPPKPVVTAWQYGFGGLPGEGLDAAAQRTTNFTSLPYFTGDAWQGGSDWPDSKLGWVQLTAEGGHAGNDLQHAAIRRWVAPLDGVVSVSGTLQHEHAQGDGITARLVSSRAGVLGAWTLHDSKTNTAIESIEVKRGDTLDFMVDFRASLNSDDFKWAPTIKLVSPPAGAEVTEWSAKREFTGPESMPAQRLSAWEQFAQVLLLANEFVFLD
ncbi:MAG TPA: PSD1 and planctomycete cytochrome C domain-containing protein [Verrucomicrobiae bacterium]|nr:PSD1 and planctomycete cytochrome C domain-containing protein [Verrucomicrobiae bacterium]